MTVILQLARELCITTKPPNFYSMLNSFILSIVYIGVLKHLSGVGSTDIDQGAAAAQTAVALLLFGAM